LNIGLIVGFRRDITRKPQEKEQCSATKESHDKPSSSSVHPLFDMGTVESNTSSSFSKSVQKDLIAEIPAKALKPHVSTIKGSDGKSISANVFNATQLIDDEMAGSSEDKQNDLPLFAPPIKAAPSAGFLDDMVFTFGAPVERLPGQNIERTSTECDRSGSDGSESSDNDSDNEQSSSTSDAEEASENVKEPKPSRPPTAADSETSGVISSNVTPASSKDVSPQTKNETSWSCPDCFITNKNVSICAACGHNKDASTASKTLVSNISTFGKPSASGFRFGIGSEGAKNSGTTSSTISSAPKETAWGSNGVPPSKPAPPVVAPESKQDSCKNSTTNNASTTAAAEAKAGGSDKKRVPWECPDCMVQNKESDDKCVCCGHVMYKSEGDSSKANTNVFGDRAFKAAPLPSTGVSFGFGTANSTSGGIKFGFGAASEKQPVTQPESSISKPPSVEPAPATTDTAVSSVPAKETSITKTSSTPVFESSTVNTDQTKLPPPTFSLGAGAAIFGAGAKPPLFGSSSSSLFNTSHSTGSLLATPSSTTPASTLPTISESQAASTAAPAPFGFGTTPSTNGTKPFSLFDSKKEESTTKAPLFGSGLSFGNGPSATEQVSSSTGILGAPNAGSAEKPLSGSGTSLFGASAATKPLFPTFGNPPSDPKPFMATANTSAESFKPSPFGAALAGPSETQKPSLFGASSTNSVNKPLFGSSVAPAAPTANGGLTFSFGSNSNAFGAFSAANSSTPSIPSVPSTSSTTSIFGSAPAVADTSKPFQFGATIPEPTFQFGQSTAFSGSAPFQFGSSQPAAPAVPTFQIPGITAPAAPSSNFSFTSSGTRKMVAARRRLPQRK
ncbi:hypothetical protein COOONC_28180, partial [Cooperia oncophora]